MKNLIFTFLALTLFSLNGYSQDIDKVSVEATFEIGRNSKNCKKFGICTKKKVKIKITIERKSIEKSQGATQENEFVTIFNKQKDGSVYFYLTPQTVESMKDYMQSDVFIVEEDYVLDQKEINIENHIIKVGEYKYNFDTELKMYYLHF